MAGVIVFGAGRAAGGCRIVDHFIHVIPRRRIEDVVVAVWFRLREHGHQLVRGFECCGGEVEAVQVCHVRLVADISCIAPVREKLAERMRCHALAAEVRVR